MDTRTNLGATYQSSSAIVGRGVYSARRQAAKVARAKTATRTSHHPTYPRSRADMTLKAYMMQALPHRYFGALRMA